MLEQADTFFHSPQGRLKLRHLTPDYGELIYYERVDSTEPKLSTYVCASTAHPTMLTAVLAAALGVRGVIRKQRLLYLIGQTRVHLDTVEGLGHFVELEVVLRPDQTLAEGQRLAAALMQTLAIHEMDLLPGAYIDLLP